MPLTTKTLVTFTCSGPRCNIHLNWHKEDDISAVPDAAFRIISILPFIGETVNFCSKACLLDWLKTYVTPLSPRQQEEAKKKADADKVLEETAKPYGDTFADTPLINPVENVRKPDEDTVQAS